jgi:hypothetical protein
MSGQISLGSQSFWVSNARLSSLVELALQVAGQRVGSANEERSVASLLEFQRGMWPGIDLDLAARFPTVDEKKFWAGVFHDLARLVFLRKLGNQKVTFWQSGFICDAGSIARFLTRAVQESELAWHPVTGDQRELEERREERGS